MVIRIYCKKKTQYVYLTHAFICTVCFDHNECCYVQQQLLTLILLLFYLIHYDNSTYFLSSKEAVTNTMYFGNWTCVTVGNPMTVDVPHAVQGWVVMQTERSWIKSLTWPHASLRLCIWSSSWDRNVCPGMPSPHPHRCWMTEACREMRKVRPKCTLH